MILSKGKNLNYHQYINYITLAYAFVLPLSRAADSLLAALLVLFWMLDGNIKNKINILIQSRVILALFAFLIFNFISLLWTDDIVGALDYIRTYWYLLPIFVIFNYAKKEYISKILSAFILGMFVSEIISYGVFFELWQFKHATPQNPSPFMHHIEYSVFLAFTALILLGRIFNGEDIKYKFLYSFFFITVSGNLFLTAGRTGQLAFILGLFVLAMLSFKNKLKAFITSIVLSILVIAIAFNFSTTFHDRIITGKNSLINVVEDKNYCSSLGSRVGAWIVSKDIILEHPVIGAGIIDNMEEFHALIDTKYPEMKCIHDHFMHLHNQYLQIFTQLGFIGLFLFLAIFYTLGRLQLKHHELRKIKYLYLTVLLFAFMPEVLLHRQFSLALFALIAGLLLAQNRIENEL